VNSAGGGGGVLDAGRSLGGCGSVHFVCVFDILAASATEADLGT
jgi:hypothetical protein